MFDINDKQKLISLIKSEIDGKWVDCDTYASGEIDRKILELVRPIIQRAAQSAAKNAAESIINHLYTYSEFEKDLGLK